jgi:ribonuclease HI
VNKSSDITSASPEGRCWLVHVDGAIRSKQGRSGLAVIVRSRRDRILFWWQRRAGAMTCNEAEYAAAIFALEEVLKLPASQRPTQIELYSDSRVLIDQMNGLAQAHAPALQAAQKKLRSLSAHFEQVSYCHISREQNRLADALAYEAVEGWQHPPPKKNPGKRVRQESALWDEFCSIWREK